MIYAIVAAFFAAVGILLYMYRSGKSHGEAEVENKSLEAENEAMASRPLTDTDFLNRLHTLAKQKRKDKRDARFP